MKVSLRGMRGLVFRGVSGYTTKSGISKPTASVRAKWGHIGYFFNSCGVFYSNNYNTD